MASGGMTRERFEEYLRRFNSNDPGFIEFYHDDVVLDLRGTEIRGARGILEFYRPVKEHLRETVELTHFVADATGVAAEIPTEFRCIKAWEADNFFQRPLAVGEVLRVVSFGLYWVRDGRFSRIKAARYKLVNDWRMEP